MSTMELVAQAIEFEKNEKTYVSRNDRIIAAKKAKQFILSINEIYKKNRDQKLMDVMKRLTVIKIKMEKRLKIR